MDYRTIVKNEEWKEFAKELFDKTKLRFEDADKLIDFDPFDCGAYWHYCALDMDEDAGVLNLANYIDDEVELLSNDEFIELCSVKFPKNGVTLKDIKEKLGYGCFVIEDEWKVLSDMLQEFTSVKWIEGQKPKDFFPFDGKKYIFLNLNEGDEDEDEERYGLCTISPKYSTRFLTQAKFIYMCSELFPKD